MNKKYIVRLTAQEREQLEALVTKGKADARKIVHAQILLRVDEAGPRFTDEEVAETFGVHTNTVRSIRERFVMEGLESALNRKKRATPPCEPKLDGAAQARLTALACSAPPPGRARWTLRLLGDQLVELKIVESISMETVRKALKKNELKPHRSAYWCIPPKANGEFVAAMEDVLDLYHEPYDEEAPVVCMDETNRQLVAETRVPIPAKPGQVARQDYEYERMGVADVFMFTEPLAGWRRASVTERRTAVDWAQQVKTLLDVDYPKARVVRLVMDNLNTHGLGSLYEAFAPTEARRLAKRLKIHYTPKHGSWLNVAEIELKALSVQCLDRRIPDVKTLKREVAAWEKARNRDAKGVDWQFASKDARIKLKRLYPQH